METKRRGSRQAEDSLPTGATLLPVLQVLSLVCLAISGLHILAVVTRFAAPQLATSWA